MIAAANSGKLSIQLSRQLGGVYNCACFGAFRTTGFLNVLVLRMNHKEDEKWIWQITPVSRVGEGFPH